MSMTAAKTETTRGVAELICETNFDLLPSEVVDYSKRLAMSALGGTVAGSQLPASQILINHIRRMGGDAQAVVTGAGFRSSVENAALANATFGHTTEYEDDSMPEGVTTYTVFPPVFSLAEMLNVHGKKVIEALVVGHEVQSRMGVDCRQARRRGHLNLSLTGVLGVAAAAAKVLGLDVHQTQMALSLAASQASGLARQTGTMAHLFEMGSASRDGLSAALLAAEGFTGSDDILEGYQGFCDVVTASVVTKPEITVGQWGKPFRVIETGIKRYPCCYHLQRIIDGVVELRETEDLRPEDIAKVEVHVNPFIPQIIKYSQPANGDQARFSLPHSVAVALMDDQITLKSFSDEVASNPAYAQFRERVKMVVHEDWEWGPLVGSNPVTVLLKDGRKVDKDCVSFKGQPPDLLPLSDTIEKYRLCTEHVIGKAKADESLEMLLELDKLDSIGSLAAAVIGKEQ